MKHKRFNTACICSSSNYHSSRNAHRNMLERNHKEFTSSNLHKEIAAKPHTFSPNSIVTILVFGKPVKVTYQLAKDAGFEVF